ncbi:MAG: four helix bundle protein [Cyclobacteriaceae bacterium]|nr:four helix bundle protein [Cyclobacteriaceae bacterium]
MFDFEKLEVYQMAKTLVVDSLKTIYSNNALDPHIKEHWRRASMDILLKLSNATAQMDASEKRESLTQARGAVFECVAILEVASQLGHVPLKDAQGYYERYEAVSKMLLAMYRSHSN